MRFTIGKKLTLGIGVLLALFVAMGLIAYTETGVIGTKIREITGKEEPTNAAAYEMEINLVGTGFSVLSYMHNRNSAHLESIKQDQQDFENYRNLYGTFIESSKEKTLGVRLDEGYTEFQATADELIQIEDEQTEKMSALLANLDQMDTLVDQITSSVSPSSPGAYAKLESALQMEISTNGIAKALGNYLRTHQTQYEEEVYQNEQDFYRYYEQYNRLALSGEETQWAGQVVSLFENSVEQSKVIIDLDRAKEARLANFVETRGELNAALEDGIRAATQEDLQRAEDDALNTVARITVVIAVLLIIGMLFGAVVSIITTRSITQPVKKLVAATQAVAKGDLFARVNINAKDELGDLGASFNRMTEDLQQTTVSRNYFDNMVKSMTDTLIVVSPEGMIGAVNPATCALLGYEEHELAGQPITKILEESESLFGPRNSGLKKNQGIRNVEKTYHAKDGRSIPVLFSASVMRFEDGEMQGVVCLAQDITERKRAEETIRHLAYHDHLTGLPNRRLFQDRFIVALAQAQRASEPLALMSIDLDRFKLVNDTLGHAVGDQLLQDVSSRLSSVVRTGDTLARLGGDEFSLLMPRTHRIEDAAKVADKIKEVFKSPFLIDDHEIHVTASVGISLYPFDGDAEQLLVHADAAMYRAKEMGRNNYQLYAKVMDSKPLRRLTLENGLHSALERNEFVVHYQPQADVKTGEIVGVEALVRWQHPEKGLVLPQEFIPWAEDAGLIVPLGEWVLRTACADAKSLHEEGVQPLRVAVNLSARQFLQSDLSEMIARTCEETQIDPSLLELEITETVAMQNGSMTIGVLRQLRELGIRIGIDDFGTGYSSLSNLKNFPIDTLKIDQSFIRDLTTDANDAAIATTVIAMAHSLNLRVIAEGVETAEQLVFLKQRGCHEVQGYLISKPLPVQSLKKLLASRRRTRLLNNLATVGTNAGENGKGTRTKDRNRRVNGGLHSATS
jgi:diguanylate cyclase (GGDEF)-like protein/PAS domain S-box-containing protein